MSPNVAITVLCATNRLPAQSRRLSDGTHHHRHYVRSV